MFVYRFAGVCVALVIAFFISTLTKLELPIVLAIIAFVLSIDNAIVKVFTHIYMESVLKEMEKVDEENRKRDLNQ